MRIPDAAGRTEFGIYSTGTSLKRPNFVNQMARRPAVLVRRVSWRLRHLTVATNTPCGTRIDLTRLQNLSWPIRPARCCSTR
jgi:hypothetical protein